jgi:hypothetical protein
MYKHDTTLKMAFGACFFSPILIPDPLLTVTILSQKYQELSLQVEISE